MKFPILFVTVLSLLNPILARPNDPDSNLSSILEARVPTEGVEGQPHEMPKPNSGPESIPRPLVVIGTKPGNTYQDVKSAIQSLPGVFWMRIQLSKVISFPKLVYIRIRYNVNPKKLYEVEEDGTLINPDFTNAIEFIRQLKKVPGTEGRIWKIEPSSGYETTRPDGTAMYETMYFSPAQAIDNFVNEQAALRGNEEHFVKRDVMQTLEAKPNSTQDTADTFEQYLEMLYTVQAHVGALIAPVLNDFTSQTNSSLVHQMAQSIYYDLTGSTTASIGPFNYGMSFLGNRSTISTTSANTTEIEIQKVYASLETIYSAMWAKSVNAANSTGFFAQQIYLANCLYSNDTSVFPPGFTTVSKSGNNTDIKS